jgi:serine/threonine protein kinase
MSDTRHQSIMQILAEAMDCPAGERADLLDRACAGDAPLRRAVEDLLARENAADRFLEDPLLVAAEGRADDDALPIGRTLGSYRITEEIGRGGMGAVYLAVRNDDEYRRSVAIKLIKRGMDTDAIQRRFRRERQILANLNHHYIARLFDGGTTPDGRPYLVMEHVAGRRIDRYADDRHLDEAARLSIVLKVCQAVEHAHEAHVVHGDIKPANILVTEDGDPKLLDFGIARILDAPSSASEAQTASIRVMTPEYSSPEQKRGESITAASDVYSLGAVLRELLAGRPAGDTADVPHTTLKGDLNKIVMMALRDEPDRRYESVAALGDDLRRYLERRPVNARKGTVVYRGRSFVRRHKRTMLATVAVAIVSLLGGAAFTWVTIRPPETHALAVLPFETTQPDQASESLSEGVTDSLINALGHLPSVTTPAHDSVYHLKNRPIAPTEAARELHVDMVLTGRVSSSPDRLSVEVSLFDARRSQVVWQQRYDAAASEIFSVQDQIVGDVSRKLGVVNAADGARHAPKRDTQSEMAYRDYVIGRKFWNLRTPDGYVQAIEYFQRAIVADRQYAVAYSGLADSYALQGAYFLKPAHETFPPAKAAALKALVLDDTLAAAHSSLALTVWLYDWNWRKADEEFRLAIDLDPRYVTARHWYGLYLGEMGRFDEAMDQMHEARELDPTSAPVFADSGRVFFWARRYNESADYYRRAFQMGANYSFLYEAMELHEQTDPDEYYRDLMKAAWGVDPNIYRMQGPAAFWRRDLAILLSQNVRNFRVAEDYARLGDKDRAFHALELAIQERDHTMTQLKVNPILDPLRKDPRFDGLLSRMNLIR